MASILPEGILGVPDIFPLHIQSRNRNILTLHAGRQCQLQRGNLPCDILYNLEAWRERLPYKDQAALDHLFESLRKAKLLDPDDMKIRYQIAVALYHLGEPEQAQEQCQRVLSRKPEDPEALALLLRISSAEQWNIIKN